MKKEKSVKIFSPSPVDEKYQRREKRCYQVSFPISKFPAGVIIDTIFSVNGKELNTKKREAAFKIIGKRGASLARNLLSWSCILQLEMYDTLIVVTKNYACSWKDLDKHILEEIAETYKNSGFTVKMAQESRGNGDMSR
ncbi:MAG: hypothetical protein KAR24_02465 [Candidatus Pacebacteria bacterium]|nr:hypothetical protein [Candidatus Paceibacterota bacterium]